MEGMKRVVDSPTHRKEIVVGNMSKFLTAREWSVRHEMRNNSDYFFQDTTNLSNAWERKLVDSMI